MKIIVQKFGGTSVANEESRLAVKNKIQHTEVHYARNRAGADLLKYIAYFRLEDHNERNGTDLKELWEYKTHSVKPEGYRNKPHRNAYRYAYKKRATLLTAEKFKDKEKDNGQEKNIYNIEKREFRKGVLH